MMFLEETYERESHQVLHVFPYNLKGTYIFLIQSSTNFRCTFTDMTKVKEK